MASHHIMLQHCKTTHSQITSTYLYNLVHQSWEVGALKGLLQARHLIEDAPECPDITLGIVLLPLTLEVNGKHICCRGQRSIHMDYM